MPTFTPPTEPEAVSKPFWHYYSIPVGRSVVRVLDGQVSKSGTFTIHPYPTDRELRPLLPGVDYFLGGYDYEIDSAIADELIQAGFEVIPDDPPDPGDPDDPTAYGAGTYGAGLYGA